MDELTFGHRVFGILPIVLHVLCLDSILRYCGTSGNSEYVLTTDIEVDLNFPFRLY